MVLHGTGGNCCGLAKIQSIDFVNKSLFEFVLNHKNLLKNGSI